MPPVDPGALDITTWRGAADDLGEGASAQFRLRCSGKTVDGFIVHHRGRFHAYVNRCPHAGTPLDWWPNEFWTEDRRYLICATHGAIFGPDTGVCVEGPCVGARLGTLRIEQDGNLLVVSCP